MDGRTSQLIAALPCQIHISHPKTPAQLRRTLRNCPNSPGLSEDTRGNIGLTVNIIKFASVLAALMSLVPIGQAWFSFRYYGVPDRMDMVAHVDLSTGCLLALLVAAATMMWKYATSLRGLAKNGPDDIEHVVERQAKMWLAGGLLVFVMLIGVALAYVASFGSSMSSPSAAQSPAAPIR